MVRRKNVLHAEEKGDIKVLRIAGIKWDSVIDGTGYRTTIFLQGCTHNCPGCHNPETHDLFGGKLVPIKLLMNGIAKTMNYISGVTLSGGEPFLQSEKCIELVECIRKHCPKLDIWVYTGFTFKELLENEQAVKLMNMVDILIDGPYIQEQRDIGLAFRGSTNQRILSIQKLKQQGEL